MSPRVTREDVARVAGTSTAVVSYVINNGPRPVADATRRRVLAAIDAVGYEPDTIARALASGTTGSYGLIVPDISNPFFAGLAHELQLATAAAGRVVILADAAEDKQRETELLRSFAARRIDGLLFVGVDDDPDLTPILAASIPTVSLDRTPDSHPLSSVAIDNVAAARDVTAHLIAHGYTHIGIVGGPPELLLARERSDGWRQALADAGIPVDRRWAAHAPFTNKGGFDAAMAMLTAPDRPRAIFAASEQQAVGLLSAASDLGLRVPDDLAVISFDGTDASEYTVPRLSGAVQPLGEIAQAAVSLLDSARAQPPAHVVIPHRLRLRPSCGDHSQ
ncbi:LacI family DNA-binding transcriptional regulator [Microbacterium sp.]|uniref:LacI family DNA-binding transcriptional regulator n=1 Tax=Microbacterium sp. TaxID=51671 RepID=UPI003A907C75